MNPDPGQPVDPVSLLLSHPQAILAVLAVVAWIFGKVVQAAKAQAGPRAAGDAAPAARPAEAEPEEERVRRVREEVRRTIEARRRPASPLLAPPVPDAREAPQDSEDPFQGTDVAEPQAPWGDSGPAPVPVSEPEFAARARPPGELTDRPVIAAVPAPEPVPVPAVATVAQSLGRELRTPSAARRAMVLREILGPPVALRASSTCRSSPGRSPSAG